MIKEEWKKVNKLNITFVDFMYNLPEWLLLHGGGSKETFFTILEDTFLIQEIYIGMGQAVLRIKKKYEQETVVIPFHQIKSINYVEKYDKKEVEVS